MRNPLFDRRSPRELAERGQAIEKEEKLGSFPQLSGIVAADLAAVPEEEAPAKWRGLPVAIRLAFGWADARQSMPILEGRATAHLPAVCQRCLAPFELRLERDLKLLFTGPGGGTAEADDYEIWETDQPTIRPLDVVEEALIMAMPLSAMHNSGECRAPASGNTPAAEGGVRPFADLRSQMREKE